MASIAATSPVSMAKRAGIAYFLTFVTGALAFFARGPLGAAAGIIAGVSYIAVTLLFYALFKPVSRGLSSLAALISFGGIAIGPLSMLHMIPFQISPLVFFGFYCLLIGYLILKSTFLPRFLGALMVFAGLGWLTFLSPSLSKSLSPYNMFPGVLGEGALTAWLLLKGVDAQRWQQRASGGEVPLG